MNGGGGGGTTQTIMSQKWSFVYVWVYLIGSSYSNNDRRRLAPIKAPAIHTYSTYIELSWNRIASFRHQQREMLPHTNTFESARHKYIHCNRSITQNSVILQWNHLLSPIHTLQQISHYLSSALPPYIHTYTLQQISCYMCRAIPPLIPHTYTHSDVSESPLLHTYIHHNIA